MLKSFYTYQLAKDFYRDCQQLKLTGPARDQFERALLSVVLNLAEGSGKPTAKDRSRFYSIALGSLREVQALLDLFGTQALREQGDRLGGMIFRVSKSPGGS